MTDIVERLRNDYSILKSDYDMARSALADAREDNERLRAEVAILRTTEAADLERLRALLREAVLYDSQIIHMESWWRKARRALEPKP